MIHSQGKSKGINYQIINLGEDITMITSSNITAKTTLHINGEDYSSTKEYSRAKDINLEELIDYAESLANNLNCTATVSVVKKLD